MRFHQDQAQPYAEDVPPNGQPRLGNEIFFLMLVAFQPQESATDF